MKSNLTFPEWMVMSVLWGREPQTLSEVIEAMGEKMKWSYKTYSTYLRKLCEKGVAGFESRGRDKYYYAKAGREQCIRAESRDIVKKVTAKGIKEMVVSLVEESGLSHEDYSELLEMLVKLEKGEDKA